MTELRRPMIWHLVEPVLCGPDCLDVLRRGAWRFALHLRPLLEAVDEHIGVAFLAGLAVAHELSALELGDAA